MPNYKYRVIFEDGKIGRGKIMALNKAHAIESLKRENNQPIMLKRMNEKRAKYKRLDYEKLIKKDRTQFAPNKKKIDITKMTLKDLMQLDLISFRTIKERDIIIFINNLYILKKAKFNNVQALQAIFEETENPKLKDIIEDILIGVQAGERINTVMQNYPRVFPLMFVNFIRVGEESGNLDTALLYARDYMESSSKLKKQVRGAIVPRILQFVGIMVAMFVMLIVGVPIIKDVYDMFDSSQKIPQATLIALDVAQWIISNWYVIVIPLAILIGIFLILINTPKGRYNWDRFKLLCPVVGPLITSITVNKFFKAMLLNLRNGMRIQESLEVSKNVTTNYYFLSAVELGKVNSISGTSWIEPFVEKKLFKPMVSQMVDIGMKTDLSEMMEKVNEYIQMEIDEALAKFVKVLPEITYAFVGVALIAFVITVVIPIIIVYMGAFIDVPT